MPSSATVKCESVDGHYSSHAQSFYRSAIKSPLIERKMIRLWIGLPDCLCKSAPDSKLRQLNRPLPGFQIFSVEDVGTGLSFSDPASSLD